MRSSPVIGLYQHQDCYTTTIKIKDDWFYPIISTLEIKENCVNFIVDIHNNKIEHKDEYYEIFIHKMFSKTYSSQTDKSFKLPFVPYKKRVQSTTCRTTRGNFIFKHYDECLKFIREIREELQ